MERSLAKENPWDDYAQRDRLNAFGDTVDLDLFVADGLRYAEQILHDADPWLAQKGTAVDIGCGTGYIALPMAGRFREVVGVDISPTALEGLRENCKRSGISNVRAFLPAESWHLDLEADLVYSRRTLQHLEDVSQIEAYLSRIRDCLSADGVAHLHFDARPETLPYRIRHRLPEQVLAVRRDWRPGLRRVRRSSETLRRLFASAGLAVVGELRPESTDTIFLLKTA